MNKAMMCVLLLFIGIALISGHGKKVVKRGHDHNLRKHKSKPKEATTDKEKTILRIARDEAIIKEAIASLYQCSEDVNDDSKLIIECQRKCSLNASCGSFVINHNACWQKSTVINTNNPKEFVQKWCTQQPRKLCGSPTAILDKSLVQDEMCATRFARGVAYRYFSLLQIRDVGYTLMARVGRYPDANPHESLVFWSQVDNKLTNIANQNPQLLPNLRAQHYADRALRDAGHNYAWLKCFGQKPPTHPVLYGGRGEVDGIVHAVVHPDLRRGRFSDIRIIIQANHSGCIEAIFSQCRFDGKISAVQAPHMSTSLEKNSEKKKTGHPREVLLYLRLNQGHNFRFLQVSKAPTPHGPFGSLQPISIATWDACRTLHTSIYFASMNPNPVDDETILALLPTHWNNQCTLYLTASCDGIHFSPPVPLLDLGCIEEGRSQSYPVDGFFLHGDSIYFYIHTSMPTRDSIAHTTFDPALRRYTLHRGALKFFTTKAKIALGNTCPGEFQATAVAPPFKSNFTKMIQSDDHRLSHITQTCERSRLASAIQYECDPNTGNLIKSSIIFRPYDSHISESMIISLEPNICQKGTKKKNHAAFRVAVCIVGTRLELFLSRTVQRGIRDHLHHPGYEYFISIDKELRPDHPSLELKSSIRAIWIDNDSLDNPRYARDTCTHKTANHRFLVPMARRLAKSYYLVQNAEKQDKSKYDYILRIRPDHLFLRKLPRVENWLHMAGHSLRIILYDDQLALSTREYAETLLLGPQSVYTNCYNADRWSKACAITKTSSYKSHFSHDLNINRPPCCPMNLIIHSPYFRQNLSSALHDNAFIRQCNSIRRPTCGALHPCDIDLLRGFHRHNRQPRTEYICLDNNSKDN